MATLDSKERPQLQSIMSIAPNEFSSPKTGADPSGGLLWYFAYGSNMSSEKFTRGRGISPLAKANVSIPGWRLTMEIPGLPYSEPGMSSIAQRQEPVKRAPTTKAAFESHPGDDSMFHGGRVNRDRDVMGVAYLITSYQYIQVIRSEGGGIAYKDTTLDARAITEWDRRVIGTDDGKVEVRTLVNVPFMSRRDKEPLPSERYKRLLVSGAEDASLPESYLNMLREWPSYVRPSRRMTGKRCIPCEVHQKLEGRFEGNDHNTDRFQEPNHIKHHDQVDNIGANEARNVLIKSSTHEHKYKHNSNDHDDEDEDDRNLKHWIGALIFLAVWAPLLSGMEKLTYAYVREDDGLVPRWVKWIVRGAVWIIWWAHDIGFAPIFGRGDGRNDLDHNEDIDMGAPSMATKGMHDIHQETCTQRYTPDLEQLSMLEKQSSFPPQADKWLEMRYHSRGRKRAFWTSVN